MPQRFAVIPEWVLGRHLSPPDLAVYVALAVHVDTDGYCWPAQKKVAAMAGMSRRGVQDALERLREIGVVEWAPQARDDGGRASNRYFLPTDPPAHHVRIPPAHDVRIPLRTTCASENSISAVRGSGLSVTPEEVTSQVSLSQSGVEVCPAVEDVTDDTLQNPQDHREELGLFGAIAVPVAPVDRFDEWWAIVPRRSSKAAARKAWPAAVKAAGGVDAILEATRKGVGWNRGSGPKFIPHPTTWLHGHRWEDEEPTKGDVWTPADGEGFPAGAARWSLKNRGAWLDSRRDLYETPEKHEARIAALAASGRLAPHLYEMRLREFGYASTPNHPGVRT